MWALFMFILKYIDKKLGSVVYDCFSEATIKSADLSDLL